MGLVNLLFGGAKKGRVGVIEFDATLSETHTRESDVTEHPIEDGSNPVDHIRRKPASLEINGVVSDTPLVFLASFRAPSPDTRDISPASERVSIADLELQNIIDEGELVTVVTSLREYENMALVSYSVTRDSSSGNMLNASLSLREVVITQTQTVSLPVPVVTANKSAANLGTQAKPPVDAASAVGGESESLLRSGLGALGIGG